MLTAERAELLTSIIMEDPSKAQEILTMSPVDAIKIINKDGDDFTVDELEEYGEELKKVLSLCQEGELTQEALVNVSGGLVLTTGMVIGLIGCFAGGTAIGMVAASIW